MKMLRDFVYSPNAQIVFDALKQFDFTLPKEKGSVALTSFEVITPDSFMWRVNAGNIYYLYAEDYVPGLEYISSVFQTYLKSKEWEFVPYRNPKKFEQSNPVLQADVYQGSDDADDMMKYAGESGYDFVFLVRSKEDPSWALFSDHAPQGYLRT